MSIDHSQRTASRRPASGPFRNPRATALFLLIMILSSCGCTTSTKNRLKQYHLIPGFVEQRSEPVDRTRQPGAPASEERQDA